MFRCFTSKTAQQRHPADVTTRLMPNVRPRNDMTKARSNIWKYLFPAFFSCVDAGLTLLGQPLAYWQDYSQAAEMAPQFAFLMKIHPMVFVAGVGIWILGYSLLIRFTPRWPSLVISLTFLLGHAFGAITWLLYYYRMNYFFIFLLFPMLAAVVVLIVRMEKRPNHPMQATPNGAPDG